MAAARYGGQRKTFLKLLVAIQFNAEWQVRLWDAEVDAGRSRFP
jgi:hypothetical protein